MKATYVLVYFFNCLKQKPYQIYLFIHFFALLFQLKFYKFFLNKAETCNIQIYNFLFFVMT